MRNFAVLQDKNNSPRLTLEGLKRLEYRGYDSWGIGSVKNSQVVEIKDVGKIGEAKVNQTGQLAIGHTRWATHGGVTKQNAHPHLSCDQRWAVIHNGIIDNHEGLRDKLRKEGHTFASETDSEVIAHLLEEKDFFEVFGSLEGLNAVVALDAKEKKIYAAKTGSPLVVGFGENAYYLSSDAAALLPHTRKVYFLEDNQGVVIDHQEIKVWEITDMTAINFTEDIETLDWSVEEAQLLAYYLALELNLDSDKPRNLAKSVTVR